MELPALSSHSSCTRRLVQKLSIRGSLLLPTSKHTADGLLPRLATDLGLNALVLLLGNFFTHLPITGIAAQNIRVEDCDGTKCNAHRPSEEVLERPRNAAHEDVECEAPNSIEEETKVHGNHNA